MADTRGDDLAESLQNLFTSVSSMVKSELQVMKKIRTLQIISNPIADLKLSLLVVRLELGNE